MELLAVAFVFIHSTSTENETGVLFLLKNAKITKKLIFTLLKYKLVKGK
jgi:hypothetical protein